MPPNLLSAAHRNDIIFMKEKSSLPVRWGALVCSRGFFYRSCTGATCLIYVKPMVKNNQEKTKKIHNNAVSVFEFYHPIFEN